MLGSPTFKLRVSRTSGAIKSGVPTTSGGKGIIINAAKGSTKVVFAYPSSWTTKTPNFEIFTMAWGSTSGFVESTAQVADYRGGENGLAEYKIYT